ncbi:MAG: NAD(P)H-hydrate dehydratase [Proteobacteria bacterium]|nr:NAD(P)H-hydrate dehydratase [Pseudomonadota bacterium]
MEPLLTSEQMRAVDRTAIEHIGIPELVLVEHAALAVVGSLKSRFNKSLPITKGVVLAGPGNNGADALASVRLLHEQGCQDVFVVLIDERGSAELSPLAAIQLSILGKLGIATGTQLTREMLSVSDWVIDGIFGTGLRRDLSGKSLEAVQMINTFAGKKWILSIDVPSGLNSDTGKPMGDAVRANQTVTLGFMKRGLVTAQGADFVGQVRLAPIQIPRLVPFPVDSFLYTQEDVSRLPFRKKSSHKGDYGHVWVMAGTDEKQGACILSALGALKSGAGLVSLLGEKSTLEKIQTRLPAEVMTENISPDWWKAKPKGSLVLGPGLGLNRWDLIKSALQSKWPLVLDADALTLISENSEESEALLQQRESLPTVMTPHPKEAARLLGGSADEIELDRFAAVKKLSEKYRCLFVLKGKGTCVRGPKGPTFVLTQGDSGLAKGGSGDLLSGILGTFLLQNLTLQQAVLLSVYLHGRSSELLTQKTGSERASLPSEIAGELTTALKELES